mmetsp:Transcript_33336/g.84347  ORF Transcript_33336/g.84347 Transcript_33336/m.84347 type:complete len:301 (-) Transcript_33336:57-959(-)
MGCLCPSLCHGPSSLLCCHPSRHSSANRCPSRHLSHHGGQYGHPVRQRVCCLARGRACHGRDRAHVHDHLHARRCLVACRPRGRQSVRDPQHGRRHLAACRPPDACRCRHWCPPGARCGFGSAAGLFLDERSCCVPGHHPRRRCRASCHRHLAEGFDSSSRLLSCHPFCPPASYHLFLSPSFPPRLFCCSSSLRASSQQAFCLTLFSLPLSFLLASSPCRHPWLFFSQRASFLRVSSFRSSRHLSYPPASFQQAFSQPPFFRQASSRLLFSQRVSCPPSFWQVASSCCSLKSCGCDLWRP